MIEDALSYPFEGDEGVENFLIGGLLLFVSILIFPIFIVMGYYMKVFEGALDEAKTPPSFTDSSITRLLKDGFMYCAISLIYTLVPLLLGLVALGLSGFSLSADALAGVTILLFLIAMLLYLIIAYFLPAAIINYIEQGSFSAAFDLSSISNTAFTGEYLKAYLIAFLLGMGIGFVSGIISLIPIVGWLITPFISFYLSVVTHRIIGQGYRNAREKTAA